MGNDHGPAPPAPEAEPMRAEQTDGEGDVTTADRALAATRQAGWESWHNDNHPGIGDAIRAMADAMFAAICSLPIEDRMEVMGMTPALVLEALGGVYNGPSTTPYHWWRLPLKGEL